MYIHLCFSVSFLLVLHLYSHNFLVFSSTGVPKLFRLHPKNNGARDWGPPSTMEVAYNIVHTHFLAYANINTTQKNNSLPAIILFYNVLRKNINIIYPIQSNNFKNQFVFWKAPHDPPSVSHDPPGGGPPH